MKHKMTCLSHVCPLNREAGQCDKFPHTQSSTKYDQLYNSWLSILSYTSKWFIEYIMMFKTIVIYISL